jgi:two-component system chemotaxis response regulator CheB
MTGRVRVLLVEDSITVRKRLVDVLHADGGFEVIGEASDGRQAIEMCVQRRPDVIAMDMVLPVLNGLAATEHIMAHCPTPILIVSASLNRGETFSTYDALTAGAVDVFEKPTGSEDTEIWERKFLSCLRIVSRVRVITHRPPRLLEPAPARNAAVAPLPLAAISGRPGLELAVVGASTGGPGALIELFAHLPVDFRLPVLVVMHLDRSFAASFAEWLGSQIGRSTGYARDREPLSGLAGCVRLAPPDRHLIVRSGRLQHSDEPPRHFCRPSVDLLFESVAHELGDKAAACLLTGMGQDGAAGLLEMRRRGAATFAQDEQSCTVFGMPRAAIELGAAERVMPPAAMAQTLGHWARAR